TDLAGLVERDQKRFRRGLDSLHRSIPLQRAPLKNRSFRGTLCLRVEFLKREQERLIRVTGECFDVLSCAERPETRDESIVCPVQVAAGIGDSSFRCIGELRTKDVAYRVTHLEHSTNSEANGGRYRQRLENTAAAHDD